MQDAHSPHPYALGAGGEPEVLDRRLRVEVERLVGVYSDPYSQTFAYPTGEVVQFVTSCFRCRARGGVARPDGEETTAVAFFDPAHLPDDLLPMHPAWLSNALSSGVGAFVR